VCHSSSSSALKNLHISRAALGTPPFLTLRLEPVKMAAFEQLRAGHTSPPHQPSARWTVSPTTRISSRPLGALEARFDASSQLEGMSDTFIRLQLELPGEREDDYVWKRLGWSWAALRSSHPALAMVVRDGEQGVREFVYEASSGVEESARTAWETLVVEEIGEDEEGETTVEGVMERVQAENVINGPRVLLDQARCLARLVIVRDRRSGCSRRHGFFLHLSHIAGPFFIR
jgi:hypothetical protein